jgi:hypothetical protein
MYMARASMRNKVVTLYLPTEADVKRWQALAKTKRCSLSRWTFELVELALENRPPPGPTTDTDELNRLRKENSDLKTEIDQIKQLNYSLRLSQAASAYLATHEALTFEQKVKATLQKGGIWNGEKLGKELGLDLMTGQQDFQKLNRLLRRLIDEEVVEEVGHGGFRWKAKS